MSRDGGWICLHRRIREHWIWSDAERLKWWLDLLLMASSREHETLHDTHKVTLQPGQMIISSSQLALRWGRCQDTILTFLRALEKEEMIKRKRIGRITVLITICNYEDYQSEPPQPIGRITGHSDGFTSGCIVAPTPYNNKNISPPPRACACEEGEEKRVGEKAESRESVMRWGAEATKDEELQGLAVTILGGARVEWSALVRSFGLEQVEKQHVYPTYVSYKGHLINWIRKHISQNATNYDKLRNDDNSSSTREERPAGGRIGRGYSAGVGGVRRAPEYEWDAEKARRSFQRPDR